MNRARGRHRGLFSVSGSWGPENWASISETESGADMGVRKQGRDPGFIQMGSPLALVLVLVLVCENAGATSAIVSGDGIIVDTINGFIRVE